MRQHYFVCKELHRHESMLLEQAWYTLQSEASKWAEKRDAYAQESHKASLYTTEMQSAAEKATLQLTRLRDDIAQAKKQLLALERCYTLCFTFKCCCTDPSRMTAAVLL